MVNSKIQNVDRRRERFSPLALVFSNVAVIAEDSVDEFTIRPGFSYPDNTASLDIRDLLLDEAD
jgi:hypothetical protein